MKRLYKKQSIWFFPAALILSFACCFFLFVITLALPHTLEATKVVNSIDKSLLQYTSDGHVLGFGKGSMHTASSDHALKVEFVGANDVSPFDNNPSSFSSKSSQKARL